MKEINHLDLFSGIGGFSKAIEELGIKTKYLGFSDIDKYANEVFQRRFAHGTKLGDIVSIKSEELPNIDLVTGGFPCQAFSIAGKRQGFDDTRGTLFFEIARILSDFNEQGRPVPHVILENVKGLLSHDNGRTLAKVYEVLTDLGYVVDWAVWNTRWFLPQNRERIFLVCHHTSRYPGGKGRPKVFPVKRDGRQIKVELNQIGTIGKDSEATRVYDTSCSRTIKNGGGLGAKTGLYRVHTLQPRSPNRPSLKYSSGGSGPLSKEDGTTYCLDTGNTQAVEHKTLNKNQTEKLDKLQVDSSASGCLTEAMGRGGSSAEYLKMLKKNEEITGRIRRLTPIECERLQGFPDNWTEGNSNTQRYKQCGNAVSVPVVKEIMRQVYEIANV